MQKKIAVILNNCTVGVVSYCTEKCFKNSATFSIIIYKNIGMEGLKFDQHHR